MHELGYYVAKYTFIQGCDDRAESVGEESQGKDRGSVNDSRRKVMTRISFVDLLKLNQPDWFFVLVGIVCSALIGCLFPLIAIPFSEVLRVRL